MPTTNNKNKTTNAGTKNAGKKNSKTGAGLTNTVPSAKARDRAKDMDSKRRGDTESFNI